MFWAIAFKVLVCIGITVGGFLLLILALALSGAGGGGSVHIDQPTPLRELLDSKDEDKIDEFMDKSRKASFEDQDIEINGIEYTITSKFPIDELIKKGKCE